MITALVSTARASWMMGIFRASHEDRFHRTPEEDSSTVKVKRDEAGTRTNPEATEAELTPRLDLPVNPEQIPPRSNREGKKREKGRLLQIWDLLAGAPVAD